jgi:hypothetical protein
MEKERLTIMSTTKRKRQEGIMAAAFTRAVRRLVSTMPSETVLERIVGTDGKEFPIELTDLEWKAVESRGFAIESTEDEKPWEKPIAWKRKKKAKH